MGRLFIANMVAGWALGMLLAALPGRAWAANVGNTVWEDADPEATARAVQVHLIRLASADAKQVEQARLGLESLGLNALAPLQAALADPDRPAAEQEKIQALIDYFQTAAVIELHDQFGAPLANQQFRVQVHSPPTAEELKAMDLPAGTDMKLMAEVLIQLRLQVTLRTDAAGRLVAFGLPDGENLSLFIFHLPQTFSDGVATEIFGPRQLAKRRGEILKLNMVQPTGVVPSIEIRGERNQPLPFAAIAVFAADKGTWRWTWEGVALSPDHFQFDLDHPGGRNDSLARLTALQLWNSATTLYESRIGTCILRTDATGDLEPGRLPPGSYGLWILAPGYAPLKVPEFKLLRETPADAKPTVYKLTPTARSFCAGTLQTADGQPLKGALAFLLPSEQIYDPYHIQELWELEGRRADQRRTAAIRAGKNPADLPPPPKIPAYAATIVPLDYIQELTAYPQLRVARSQASGRIEFKDLAAGKYVLRVFVAPPGDDDPAHAVEFFPVPTGTGPAAPPTIEAKDGAPIDLGALQYKQAPAATLDPPTAPLPGETPPPAEKGAAP